MENPGALTPIRHTNLALNSAGVRGSILVDFPCIGALHNLRLNELNKFKVIFVNFHICNSCSSIGMKIKKTKALIVKQQCLLIALGPL
jgi:hypothetical protein